MRLPFSREAFFEVLAAYNAALWPAVIALWALSVLAVWLLWRGRTLDRWISGLLAVHWVWSAIAYHAVFFTRINPAAWLFAVLFLIEGVLFFWSGVIRGRLTFRMSGTPWTAVGWLLVVYALGYPAINLVEHGNGLSIPTFGLPCPTTIFTAGLLLGATPSKRLVIVPVVWSLIGGSAAVLFGVSADYALPVAGAVLTVFALQRHALSSPAGGGTRHHPRTT